MEQRSKMLWRSDDLPHVLILGSIHFMDGALPGWVWEVHQGANAVVFEADFREAPPPPTMPQGLLVSSLDPELWQLVESNARDFGWDGETIRDLSVQYPFQIAQRLAISTLERAGARFEKGVEGWLL